MEDKNAIENSKLVSKYLTLKESNGNLINI